MPTGKRILCFVGDDFEDLELWYPNLRMIEAGAAVVVAGQKARHVYRGKNGYPCESDASVSEVKSADFDGVLIPGGWMPDKLRRDEHVLRLVREFNESKKMIASICHGPWINISAGIVRGVKMTSTPGIRDDLVNAGAEWVDAPVIVDRHHISSRRPSDLPVFAAEMVKFLSKA
ncbi:MAG: type 1 glutamine amidotransferase [Planctomycetes bacterium]|nr:type 1 glutamine amidotransferase [Planctomycetota bacterium]